MNNYATEVLLRNFKLNFPDIAEHMVSYKIHDLTLVATLKDGRKMLYDDVTDSLRALPFNSDKMTDEEILREFRCRLKHIMHIRCINQKELSERTGIPEATISRYITGENIPSFLKVEKIARVLNCSLDELRYI